MAAHDMDTNGQDTQATGGFFDRQIVLPDDLKQDQKYFLSHLRRENRVFRGYGVKKWDDYVSLEVENPTPAEAEQLIKSTQLSDAKNAIRQNWLRVTPGLALTPKGDVIFLPAEIYVDTAHQSADGKLMTNQSQPLCEAPAAEIRKGEYVLVVESSTDETGPVRITSGCESQHKNTRLKDSLVFRLVRGDEVKACAYGTKTDEKQDQLTGNFQRNYVRLGLITFGDEPNGMPKVDMKRQRDTLGVPCAKDDPPKKPNAGWFWLWRVLAILAVIAFIVWILILSRKGSPYEPEPIVPPFPPTMPLFRNQPELDLLQFGRYQTIHVVPAYKPPVLDGHLNGWRHESRVHSKLPSPYGDFYSFAGYLMMDYEYLYIAAHVRDPFPLRNKLDPRFPPLEKKDVPDHVYFHGDVYNGGSVMLNLFDKPGWPVDSSSSESMIHIDMWQWNYSGAEDPKQPAVAGLQIWRSDAIAPGKRQQFLSTYFASLLGSLNTPWLGVSGLAAGRIELMDKDVVRQSEHDRGVFRLDDDKQGYTLEYQIRWKSLKMDVPREPHAALFDVHWSDPTGKKFAARLADVVHGDQARKTDRFTLTYQTPTLWGKAIFHRP